MPIVSSPAKDVSQAAQFVESRYAQAEIVARPKPFPVKDQSKFSVVPADYYPPLEQAVVMLAGLRHKREADLFLDFVRTKEVGEILQPHGLTLPQN